MQAMRLGGCRCLPAIACCIDSYSRHVCLSLLLVDRYEGRVVQETIRADGGKGDFMEATPAVMGIWDTLLKVRSMLC